VANSANIDRVLRRASDRRRDSRGGGPVAGTSREVIYQGASANAICRSATDDRRQRVWLTSFTKAVDIRRRHELASKAGCRSTAHSPR